MTDGAPARGSRAAALALSLPDRLPVALLACGVSALAAVLLGQFRPWVVLPLAAALVVVTWRWVPAPPPATRGHLAALTGAVALVAGWVVLSLRFVAEYVVVNRDPGFLTLQALWLVDHPSAPIPVGGAQVAAAVSAGASAGTEAFGLHDGSLFAQGNTMLPALLATLGWAGGEHAVRAGNLVIGAVALLAVFAVARRFAGPGWALVPTAALALSLPFLVTTRAAYTEPLTVAFLCGGLAFAHGTWHGGLPPLARGRRRGAAVLAGALIGAVGTVRIDGAVTLAGLAVAVVLVAATPLGRADRRAAVRDGLAALAVAVVMVALGLVDVLRLSPDYVQVHVSQITSLLVASGVLVVLAVVAVLLPGSARVRVAALVHRVPLGRAAAGVVLLLGVVLASRPLWWQGHANDPQSGVGYAVTVLQAAAGQALDGSRSYDEQSLAWVSWYLGVPAVVLGFAGLAVLAHRAVARRDPASVLFVAVVGVAAVFPLVRVSITPDQIWAVRRLLPATFPGLLVAGACALAALSRRAGTAGAGSRRYESGGRPSRRGWRPRPGLPTVRVVVSGVLAAAVVAFPVTTWGSVAGVVELSGRATQAHAVCDELDRLGVERVVWTHSSPFRYLATLRVVCDVEVVEVLTPPSAVDLAAIRAAWGGEPVAALSFDVTDYPWTTAPTASVGGTVSQTLGRTLVGAPTTVDATWSEVWVGLVQEDGTVQPVTPAP